MSDDKQVQHSAVLGAGSWGTALAAHLSRCEHHTTLWGRDPEQIAAMGATYLNDKYLPSLPLPRKLNFTSELGSWLKGCSTIVIAVPSQAVTDLLTQIKNHLSPGTAIIIASKGAHRPPPPANKIEFLTQTAARILGNDYNYAVLSGPSFAHELVVGIPTAVDIACHEITMANELASRLHSPNFRVYTSDDPIGIQLASIGKNVIAVAAGAVDGMQLGDNTRAALICRGISELMRLGDAMNLHSNSFTGLAGIGDIILTCTCDSSRNRRFGKALGSGLTPDEAAQSVGKLVEARANAEILRELATTYRVEMPITDAVCQVVAGTISARDALQQLLNRPLAG